MSVIVIQVVQDSDCRTIGFRARRALKDCENVWILCSTKLSHPLHYTRKYPIMNYIFINNSVPVMESIVFSALL
jgi:hypothetical protein